MIPPCALMYVCMYVRTGACCVWTNSCGSCPTHFGIWRILAQWYVRTYSTYICMCVFLCVCVCACAPVYVHVCMCVFVCTFRYVDLLYVLHKPDFSVLFEGTVAVGHCVMHTYVATSVWLHFAEYYTNLCTVLIFVNCALLPRPSFLPCIIVVSLRSYTPFTFISIPTYTVCVCIRCIILAVPILWMYHGSYVLSDT